MNCASQSVLSEVIQSLSQTIQGSIVSFQWDHSVIVPDCSGILSQFSVRSFGHCPRLFRDPESVFSEIIRSLSQTVQGSWVSFQWDHSVIVPDCSGILSQFSVRSFGHCPRLFRDPESVFSEIIRSLSQTVQGSWVSFQWDHSVIVPDCSGILSQFSVRSFGHCPRLFRDPESVFSEIIRSLSQTVQGSWVSFQWDHSVIVPDCSGIEWLLVEPSCLTCIHTLVNPKIVHAVNQSVGQSVSHNM